MQQKSRIAIAWIIALFLVVQPLMPTAWAEGEITGDTGNGETVDVVLNDDDSNVANGESETPPPPPEEPEPKPEEPGDDPAENEPAPVVDTPVVLGEYLNQDRLQQATCDTVPWLNLQPLADMPTIAKVEFSDHSGNVLHGFDVSTAAGTEVWVKVTFVENHVLDDSSHISWQPLDESRAAVFQVVFTPAPTDADCTVERVLPAPTVVTDETGENAPVVEIAHIAEVEGVQSVAVEGDVVAGDDVVVRVVFEHRNTLDAVNSTDWNLDANGDALYVLTIPSADEEATGGEEGSTEGDEIVDEGETEGDEPEDTNLVALPAPEVNEDEETNAPVVETDEIENTEGVENVSVEGDVEPGAEILVVATLDDNAELDEENSDEGWESQDDGTAVFSLTLAGGVMPMAIDPDQSGITGFTITEAEISEFSESVAFNFDYTLVASGPDGLEVGDEIVFTLEGYDRIGWDQTGTLAIPLVDVDEETIVGYVEVDSNGVGRLYLTAGSPDPSPALGEQDYSGTFGFELTSEWAEEYASTEGTTDLDFTVVQEGKTPIEGTLTIPAVPEEEPDPTPEPGEDPFKDGGFTDREQGRFNPVGAITWEIKAPTGPASRAVLTELVASSAGAEWAFDCTDPMVWTPINVSADDVTVTCEDGVITVDFGPYLGETEDTVPGIRLTANITDAENQQNPADGSLTFENTVTSEVWGWEQDPETDDPLHEGEASDSITQRGTGPGEGSVANPVKWGEFTRDDEGAEDPVQAIQWTVRAPAGPAEAVRLIDEVPDGENWEFVCGTEQQLGVGGNLGASDWTLIECSPTRVVVEVGSYREFNTNNTPGFSILATITGDWEWDDDRDGRTFYNEVDSELVPWGTELAENWTDNPIARGSDDAEISQVEPDFPDVTPVKDGEFTGRDNGRYITEGAIEWTITLPDGPNGGLELHDPAPEDGSWEFVCDTLSPDPLSIGATFECGTEGLFIYFEDGYDGPGVTFTVEANILAEFEVGQELTNNIETRVADHLTDYDYGDEDGWLYGEDDHTLTQTLFSFGTGQRGERGEFPVSIGDRVWFDADRDGLQGDPEVEFGIRGVEVTLFELDPDSGDWVQFGETITTDDDGYYWFTGLASDGEYYLQFVEPTELPDGRPLGGWTEQGGGDEYDIEPPAVDSPGARDSNVDPVTGRIYFMSPTMGANEGGPGTTDNPTLDAGLVLPQVSIGDYVWFDYDRDGVQGTHPNEYPVEGVTVNCTKKTA